MDVAIGATDVPLSRRRLKCFFIAAALLNAIIGGGLAHAAIENKPIHTSGDKQFWDRKKNIVELYGHASVSQPGETLTADYITMDLNTRVLDAKGNCVYVAAGTVIRGEEMHFNLETRTGTIVTGRVSNERFSLTGERINKLGDNRFQTHWGEYTTCLDCPGTWSLTAEDVDMQIEGYAHMRNVVPKIKDAPAFWMPYLIVPMKTRRQTGLLFPTFSVSQQNGFSLVLPFFWAINDWSDMTITPGHLTSRGEKLDLEGRYILTERSRGDINYYYLRDSTFKDANQTRLNPNRWGLNIIQTQDLPWGIVEKLKLTEISDNDFPFNGGGVPGNGELYLPTTLSLSKSTPDLSAYVAMRRYRNLINTDPDLVVRKQEFDPRTVQVFPHAGLAFNDKLLFGSPLAAGVSFRFDNFTRSLDAFDNDSTSLVNPISGCSGFGCKMPDGFQPSYRAGIDPIRKATRFSVSPSVYVPFRPLDVFSVVPSVKYFGYYYAFPQTSYFSVPPLARGYMLFQTDFAAQLERIYHFDDDFDQPRSKHLIRPVLTYSYIPAQTISENVNHPFTKQIKYAAEERPDSPLPGYYFDSNDLVPLNFSCELGSPCLLPQGNSLAAGFVTQWIRRDGSDEGAASYPVIIEATATQSFNFKEYEKAEPRPLSLFRSTFAVNLERFNYRHEYRFFPYFSGIKQAVSAGVSYSLISTVHRDIFLFNRAFGIDYDWDQHGQTDLSSGTHTATARFVWSISDYILPQVNVTYSVIRHAVQSAGLMVQFQSPSRCWKFTVDLPYSLGVGVAWNLDLSLNLTGSGFGGVTGVANQVISPNR